MPAAHEPAADLRHSYPSRPALCLATCPAQGPVRSINFRFVLGSASSPVTVPFSSAGPCTLCLWLSCSCSCLPMHSVPLSCVAPPAPASLAAQCACMHAPPERAPAAVWELPRRSPPPPCRPVSSMLVAWRLGAASAVPAPTVPPCKFYVGCLAPGNCLGGPRPHRAAL